MVKFQTLLGKVRRKRGTGRRSRGGVKVSSAFTFLGSKNNTVPESVGKRASPEQNGGRTGRKSFTLVHFDSMLSELSQSLECASDNDTGNQVSVVNQEESESREAIEKLPTTQIDARDDGLITPLLSCGNDGNADSSMDMATIQQRLILEDDEHSRDCTISSDVARNILAQQEKHEGESIICYVDQQDLNGNAPLPEASEENSTGDLTRKSTVNQHKDTQFNIDAESKVDGGFVVLPPCTEKKIAEIYPVPMSKVIESTDSQDNDDDSVYIASASQKSGENDAQTEKSSTIFCPDDDGFESLLDTVHSQESSLLFEGDSLALTEEDHELSQNLPGFLLSTDNHNEDAIRDSTTLSIQDDPLSIQDNKATIISSVSIERKVEYFEEIPRKKNSRQSPIVQPTKAISSRSSAFEKLRSTFEQPRQSKTTESLSHHSERRHGSVRYRSARLSSRTMLELMDTLPTKCESERGERSFQYSSTNKKQLMEPIADPEKNLQTATVVEGQVEPWSLEKPLKIPAIEQLPKEPLTVISVVESQTADYLEKSSLCSCTDENPLASSTEGLEKMLKSTTVVEYQEDQSPKNHPLKTIANEQRPERPLANGDLDSVPSDEYNIRKTCDDLENDRCDIPFDEISEEPHAGTTRLASPTEDQDDYTDILLTGSEFEVHDLNIGSLINLQNGISSCPQRKNGSEKNGTKAIVRFEKHDSESDDPASKTEGNSLGQPIKRTESLAMNSMKSLIDFSKSITQSEEQHKEATDSKHDERRAWAQAFVKNISGMRGDCSCDALTDVDARLFSFFPWKKVD